MLKPNKCIFWQQLTFVLLVSFYYPWTPFTPYTSFTIHTLKSCCSLKVRHEHFCQNITVMLTNTHNHTPEMLLWRSSCHRNTKQNSKPFFNCDAYLTSVIIMGLKFFFAMLVSLYDIITCDVINLKNFTKILRYFFQILAMSLNGVQVIYLYWKNWINQRSI